MDNSKVERKIEWTAGKIFGLLAIILLFVGPFQTYYVWENETTGEVDSNPLLRNVFSLSYLKAVIPLLSAIVIAILLFPEFLLRLRRKSILEKISPMFLMVGGVFFILYYLTELTRFPGRTSEGWIRYMGYGYWMIVLGFLLCGSAGFLELKYPTMKIPLAGKEMKEDGQTEVCVASKPEPVTQINPKEVERESVIKEMPLKIEPDKESEQVIVPQTSEPQKSEAMEPTSEEEKTLRRWARHIDEHNQTYEQCIKCQNYVFIKAKDTEDAIIFSCPHCNEINKLKK